jgi:anti-sigma B factor antagonist
MEQWEPAAGARRDQSGHGRRPRRGLLDFDARLDGRRAVVRLVGELDLFSAAELTRALVFVQRCAPDPCLLFLLSGLSFSDSSGLGVLIGSFKRARAAGGAVALIAVPEFLQRVLRVTGLAGLLPDFPTFEEGCAWLADEGGCRECTAGVMCGPPPDGTGRTPAGVSGENTRESAATAEHDSGPDNQ